MEGGSLFAHPALDASSAVAAASGASDHRSAGEKPVLVFFQSPRSGACRRVDGLLAQVLQRNRNHETFSLRRVCAETRPDLVERFRIRKIPTFVVVERKKVRRRLEAPRTTRELEGFLRPWLR